MTDKSGQKLAQYFRTLLVSMDARERDSVRDNLLGSDHGVLLDFLVKMLQTQNGTETLAYAAELIVDSEDEQRAKLILPLLQSPDPILRRHVCGLLGNCGDRIAVDPLVSVLQSDPDPDVRVVAAYALGRIGDEKTIAALTWAKDHDTASDFEGISVKEQAIRALNTIRRDVDKEI